MVGCPPVVKDLRLLLFLANSTEACFCLLEQYLPNGAYHPFAQTMLKHFDKLRTPLKSVHSYPSLTDQRQRFISCGWSHVLTRSLWDLWSDECFLPAHQRLELNKVEAFDEWEEFALFASHYFLLIALKGLQDSFLSCFCDKAKQQFEVCLSHSERNLNFSPVVSSMSHVHHVQVPKSRKYGAIFEVQPGVISHYGGHGPQSRLQSAEVFALEDIVPDANAFLPLAAEARMCHTVTNLDAYCCLVVGGRTSPDRALADCWYRSKGAWIRVDDLPNPLYRHSACAVTKGSDFPGVLVYGGRSSNGAVMNDWLLWQNHAGWIKLKCIGDTIQPRFGATIAPSSLTCGILLGGMSMDGNVLLELWRWSLSADGLDYYITVKNLSHHLDAFPSLRYAIPRFGSSAIWSSVGLLIIGGISSTYMLPDKYDIVLMRCNLDMPLKSDCSLESFHLQPCVEEHRSLLTGHSVIACGESVVIVGGGAVCFSFGTYWNTSIWSIDIGSPTRKKNWRLVDQKASKGTTDSISNVPVPSLEDALDNHSKPLSIISRLQVQDSSSFDRIIRDSEPVIIEGLDLGLCIDKWTSEYLKEAVGYERSVSKLIFSVYGSF